MCAGCIVCAVVGNRAHKTYGKVFKAYFSKLTYSVFRRRNNTPFLLLSGFDVAQLSPFVCLQV